MVHVLTCCCTCPAIEVLFAGVDATRCTDCQQGGTSAWKYIALAVDGVWAVPFLVETATQCRYRKTGTLNSSQFAVDVYPEDEDCSALECSVTTATYTLTVSVIKGTNEIADVTFSMSWVNCRSGITINSFAFSGAVSAATLVDDTIQNSLECNVSNVYAAEGGTAVVSYA